MLLRSIFSKNKEGRNTIAFCGHPRTNITKDKEMSSGAEIIDSSRENPHLAYITKSQVNVNDEIQKYNRLTDDQPRGLIQTRGKAGKFANIKTIYMGQADIKNLLRKRSMFSVNKDEEVKSARVIRQGATKRKKKKIEFCIGGEKFLLYDYYMPTGMLGSGAYASVCAAVNTKTGRTVAIKKNKHVFKELSDAKRILREIKLMSFFDHDNIVKIVSVIVPDSSEIGTFEDIYLVLQKMDMNLSMVISSVQLSNKHMQYFVYQILRGLKYIHSAGVIHRDLKPDNILVNASNCKLKITDFGLARGVCKHEENNLTEYVVTRWYRAPEVMCCAKHYDAKVDVWSVGCILAEMMLRKPLFPGGNHLEQLRIIFEVLGTPVYDKQDWIKVPEAKEWIRFMTPSKGYGLRKIFSKATPDALSLLKAMLQLNPEKRISVNDALAEHYFCLLHKPAREFTCEKFDISFEFEAKINTVFGVRHMMYEELKNFKKNNRSKRAKK